MQYLIPIDTGTEMTTLKKVLVILKANPEVRNSYDHIVLKYRDDFPNDKVTRKTIENNARIIQYNLGIFQPSARVRRARKEKQAEIIASKHQDVSYIFRKETNLQYIARKVKSFFTF